MRGSHGFVPTRACVADMVSAVLARQPLTPGKIAFAWQMAVGPALARVTSVEHENGVLRVRSGDRRWIREVERSRAVILDRLRSLLGPAVSDLRTENSARPEGRAYGED